MPELTTTRSIASTLLGEASLPDREPFIRALHLHSGNMMGGVESALHTLAKIASDCPALKQEIALAFDGVFAQSLSKTGIHVHHLPAARLRSPNSVLQCRGALRELLNKKGFDIVISHSPWCQVIFGPALRRVVTPCVLTMHGPYTGHWLQRLASFYRPDLVLCNSEFTQLTVARMYPNTATKVIHLPVSPLSLLKEREQLRRELGCSLETIVILMASRMERWKGHLNLLQAAVRLPKTLEWMVWIAGAPQTTRETHYYDALQAAVHHLHLGHRVRFLGHRNDVPQLLQACDIHCQPNDTPEPFGMVFVEALRAGVPTVTFVMGGALEIFNNGSAILIPPGDVERLAIELARLIEGPALRGQYREAAQLRAETMFNPAQQLKKLHAALAIVVADKKGASPKWPD